MLAAAALTGALMLVLAGFIASAGPKGASLSTAALPRPGLPADQGSPPQSAQPRLTSTLRANLGMPRREAQAQPTGLPTSPPTGIPTGAPVRSTPPATPRPTSSSPASSPTPDRTSSPAASRVSPSPPSSRVSPAFPSSRISPYAPSRRVSPHGSGDRNRAGALSPAGPVTGTARPGVPDGATSSSARTPKKRPTRLGRAEGNR